MALSYQEEIRTKKRRQFFMKAAKFGISALITLASAVIILFFADLFDIRTININSPSTIPSDEIEKIVWETLNERNLEIPRKNNVIIFAPQKIIPALEEKFPRIDKVEIRRMSVHEISITITERVPVGLWCLPKRGQCYYYDAQGVAFTEIASSSGFLFIAINDYRDREIEIGHEVENNNWRQRTMEIKKILQFGGISVSSFEILEDPGDEFHVVTGEGWKILYLNDENVRKQTNSLLVFLRDSFPQESRANLEYVDLRVEDRIYYKMR